MVTACISPGGMESSAPCRLLNPSPAFFETIINMDGSFQGNLNVFYNNRNGLQEKRRCMNSVSGPNPKYYLEDGRFSIQHMKRKGITAMPRPPQP
ncbi:hypothetical protein ACFSQ7_37495 [Paenibacillus rhizoplanae]